MTIQVLKAELNEDALLRMIHQHVTGFVGGF
jgi:hypothetical protein